MLSNTGPFVNRVGNNDWSSTPDTDFNAKVLWAFDFDRCQQHSANVSYLAYAWSVHDGDVGSGVGHGLSAAAGRLKSDILCSAPGSRHGCRPRQVVEFGAIH